MRVKSKVELATDDDVLVVEQGALGRIVALGRNTTTYKRLAQVQFDDGPVVHMYVEDLELLVVEAVKAEAVEVEKLNRVTVDVCNGCLDGIGAMCTTPGCVFTWHRTPMAYGDNVQIRHRIPSQVQAADTKTLRQLICPPEVPGATLGTIVELVDVGASE